ncbi:hypothetical protein E3N88_39448 [Mikania micrantha]|uniref:TF-B3 domain-containing protein n=1 Tax=Mikania micrantha TaxID=192012 RepID=A0A5N6LX71_9ASTR|nr:hypothetical protein E3N88_39448 [Mikania micrantha]
MHVGCCVRSFRVYDSVNLLDFREQVYTRKTVPMAKACEECTQNCLMMHKKKKDPASVMTTFFKVMIGEEYSKLLVLPPIFARCVKKLVDKTTHLEDFNGEKWDVRFTKINDHLAFKEGWNAFALAHGLRQGDFLVFHYIMKSHFVVLMYGSTGCPENRHYGFHHRPVKETKKNSNNLIANGQSPSEVLTNCNNFSHESSSKSEPLVNRMNHLETSNKKLNNDRMSPNENAANTQHLVASSSRLNGHEQNECRSKSLQPVVVGSDGGQKNNVAAAGGGSGKTENNSTREVLETRIKMATEKRKESTMRQSEVPDSNPMHKRLRTADASCRLLFSS